MVSVTASAFSHYYYWEIMLEPSNNDGSRHESGFCCEFALG